MNTRPTRELVCIVCPRGCALSVELDGKEVSSVTGNICPRGKKYAINECTHPMRTVTSTVKTSDGGVVAVKTDGTIPKEKMFECMEILSSVTAAVPVHIGDVIVENVFGVNIVATQNKI